MFHQLMKRTFQNAKPTRRTFLKFSAGAGAGLLVGAYLPVATSSQAKAATADGEMMFNPFVRILPDSSITVLSKHLDKGQGTASGLCTLVAEEMDASPEQMRADFAPANNEFYRNLFFGVQGTGGSTAIPNSWEQYRKAGATARAMLVEAAAEEWDVPASEIAISNGVLRHDGIGKQASFGTFAEAASKVTPPADPPLKTPDQWVYIGKDFPRVDVPAKSEGSIGLFGIDLKLPDMLYAATLRSPRFGGKLVSFDASAAEAMDGVVQVVEVPQGVAVLANDTWTAFQARDAITAEWDFSEAENRSSDTILEEYRALAQTEGTVFEEHGDALAGLEEAETIIEAEYSFPFLAHAMMEPFDLTVRLEGDRATFWFASQLQTVDQAVAAQVLGIPAENVTINTLWAGGSFGRRTTPDAGYIVEAAMIARNAGTSRPIKLTWSREDDMRGGYYRPLVVHRVRAGLKADGTIAGWHHRIVGQSILKGTAFEAALVQDGIDATSTEGVAESSYAIPNFRGELHTTEVGVPVLWWRSVGHTHTAYAMETMMDELAEAAGEDPVAFRLKHLADAPRDAHVLRLAAEKSGWDTPPAEGRYRGVAVHKSFNSYVAEIAEISMGDGGRMRVEKVVCAVDCGIPINPDNIIAQIEGGLGYGLGAVLRNKITLIDGEVDEGNFDLYEPIRMSDMPEVEVHIVPSEESPTGIGEPGTPPIGPAVANAIFAATGQRIRDLPFSEHGLV